ncbi:alpha/beta-hydrolase [Nemania sp. FL0916]|nr:alpha/beta-hydrolase [Nemania sp. FL0916]
MIQSHAMRLAHLICCLASAAAVVKAAAIYPPVIHFDVADQRPLEAHQPYTDSRKPAPAPAHSASSWRPYPQDDRTCTANATHFTGRVPVTPEKRLFFWFVESRRDPLRDPTILWLNGGPAGSSMPGLFQEIGPCELLSNGTGFETSNRNWDGKGNSSSVTVVNPDSWANFANVLILDQPAGTGMSTAEGDSSPTTLAAASVDFSVFLSEFVARFPQYFDSGFYVAGESFGGRYVPRYVADIVSAQQQQQQRTQKEKRQGKIINNDEDDDDDSNAALPVKIDGIILVDAYIDGISRVLGYYEMFCTDEYQDRLRFNETACSSIAAATPRAEYLLNVCQETYEFQDCLAAVLYASANIEIYFQEVIETGKYSPYDLRLPCDLPNLSCIPPNEFYSETHLNRPEVQKLLGFDPPHRYRAVNMSLNFAWAGQPEMQIPTTRNVSWLLDEGDVRILVFNGDYDGVITTPGMFREFDNLPWSQNEVFRKQPKVGWRWVNADGESAKGGKIKGVPKLVAASVYDAGHMSPGDAKPAVASLVRSWIKQKGFFF